MHLDGQQFLFSSLNAMWINLKSSGRLSLGGPQSDHTSQHSRFVQRPLPPDSSLTVATGTSGSVMRERFDRHSLTRACSWGLLLVAPSPLGGRSGYSPGSVVWTERCTASPQTLQFPSWDSRCVSGDHIDQKNCLAEPSPHCRAVSDTQLFFEATNSQCSALCLYVYNPSILGQIFLRMYFNIEMSKCL